MTVKGITLKRLTAFSQKLYLMYLPDAMRQYFIIAGLISLAQFTCEFVALINFNEDLLMALDYAVFWLTPSSRPSLHGWKPEYVVPFVAAASPCAEAVG